MHQEIGKAKDQGMRPTQPMRQPEQVIARGSTVERSHDCHCAPSTKALVSAGIWTKDLRRRTGLATNVITKALKVLEQRELVKSVKSVQHGNRKQYMLFDVEPSEHVTGGVW